MCVCVIVCVCVCVCVSVCRCVCVWSKLHLSSSAELKGLYLTSINTQGAVRKDGRAKVNDRILRVDGHSMRGLENMEAAAILRNSGNPVRLVFGRPRHVAGRRKGERGERGERERDSALRGKIEVYLYIVLIVRVTSCFYQMTSIQKGHISVVTVTRTTVTMVRKVCWDRQSLVRRVSW